MVLGDQIPKYVNFILNQKEEIQSLQIYSLKWDIWSVEIPFYRKSQILQMYFLKLIKNMGLWNKNFFVIVIDNANYKFKEELILTDRRKKILDPLKNNKKKLVILKDNSFVQI